MNRPAARVAAATTQRARYSRAVELLLLVEELAIVVALVVTPWLVLRWAKRSFTVPRTPVQRVTLGLATGGIVMGFAAPIVAVVLLVASFSEVAGADSTAKATALARGISEAWNCGAMLALVDAAVTSAAVVMLLWHRRARLS